MNDSPSPRPGRTRPGESGNPTRRPRATPLPPRARTALARRDPVRPWACHAGRDRLFLRETNPVGAARPIATGAGADAGETRRRGALLDLDLGADFLELLLDRRGLVLVDAFLDGLRRGLDEVLRFLQAE